MQGRLVGQQPPLKRWEIKIRRIVLTGSARRRETPAPAFLEGTHH